MTTPPPPGLGALRSAEMEEGVLCLGLTSGRPLAPTRRGSALNGSGRPGCPRRGGRGSLRALAPPRFFCKKIRRKTLPVLDEFRNCFLYENTLETNPHFQALELALASL